MSIPFSVNGARTVIPGVYDYLRVQDSLPSPVPGPRSIVIIGEAQSGVPSKFLDMRLNYFTDYNSLLVYYKKGPLVDAARQLFANQPSPAFSGSVSRVYVYKTNNTQRAEKVISLPANFGALAAAVWEEDGNLIKSQIKSAASEVKPSKSFQYIPAGGARTLNVIVSGKKFTSGALAALATPVAAQSALSAALTGSASVTGGALRSLFVGADTADLVVSAVADELTITLSPDTSTSTFASVLAGDVLVIPHASSIVGASSENAGSYVVLSASATAITAQKIHSISAVGADIDYVAPGAATGTNIVVADQAAYATAEVMVFSPITITVTEATVVGAGASLELLDSSAGTSGLRGVIDHASFSEIIGAQAATVGFISATASGSSLSVSLSGATFSLVARPGDIVKIGHSSAIAGASKENVGLYVVSSANASALSLTSLVGSALASVASVTLGGVTSHIALQAGFVTSSFGARKIVSDSEAQVMIEASRQKDNSVWPSAAIGGKSFIEISYNDGVATAASLSINQTRKLTVTFVGGPAAVSISTLKYETLGGLVSYLNSLPGFSARVIENKDSSLSVKVLDMVSSVGILAGSSAAQAQNGRIKGDYYLWAKHFQDNSSNLLAFKEGSLVLKAGLPTVESVSGFLNGAAIGGTSGAEVQAALDASLKVDASQVLPLFSRDALYDIQDGYTDPSSSYTIDAVHAATSSHCATASGSLVRKERFGLVSFHGSFAETKAKASAIAFERVQMAFQLARSVNSQGSIEWIQPWVLCAVVAAGRAQGALGTSMLRKSFNISEVKHIGNLPPFSDTLSQDFEPDSFGELSEGIESGLLCFQAKTGSGVQLVSPDLTTRSREGDPQGWLWERCNVLFCLDEVRKSVRGSLENFIGARTSDVSPAFVKKAIGDILTGFVQQGALIKYDVIEVKSLGNSYTAQVSVTPTESLEAIVIDVIAERNVSV